MNELVIMHNKQAVTTSLRVAEVFGKDHKNVMQAIKAKIQSAENSADYQKMFAEGTYKDGQGNRQRPAVFYQQVSAKGDNSMSLLEAIMSVLFDPTSAFWKYLLVAMAGVMIGATAVGGWKQWIE